MTIKVLVRIFAPSNLRWSADDDPILAEREIEVTLKPEILQLLLQDRKLRLDDNIVCRVFGTYCAADNTLAVHGRLPEENPTDTMRQMESSGWKFDQTKCATLGLLFWAVAPSEKE